MRRSIFIFFFKCFVIRADGGFVISARNSFIAVYRKIVNTCKYNMTVFVGDLTRLVEKLNDSIVIVSRI